MSRLTRLMASIVLGAVVLCGSNQTAPSKTPDEQVYSISEMEEIARTLIELEEVSKIQFKITSIRRKIDQQLAYTIAESVYRNCKESNKDPDMILAIMAIESYFIPRAKSPAGARGLMQVMPFWAKEFGISVEDLYDIDMNIKAGIKILTSYEKLYKRYDLVLTTYNKGPVLVKRDLRNGIDPRTGYSSAIIKMHKRLKRIDFGSEIYLAQK